MIQLTGRNILSHILRRMGNSPWTGGVILLTLPLWLGQGSQSQPPTQAESWRELIAQAGRAAQKRHTLELYSLLHPQTQHRLRELAFHWRDMSTLERLRAFWGEGGLQPAFAQRKAQALPAPRQWAQIDQVKPPFLLHLYLQKRPNIFSQLYRRSKKKGCRIYPTKGTTLFYHCFSFTPLELLQGKDGFWRLRVRHFYYK
jgi:hypothetical protein